MEFMLISQAIIPGSLLPHCLVVIIKKRNIDVPMLIRSVMTTFEGEKNIRSSVSSGLEIGGPDREVGEAGPDQLTGICENIRCCL